MAQHPSAWTRLTDRLNAVIWQLPLPRRAQMGASELIYRSPPMTGERVHETLDALTDAHVEAWCMGGWGVDALLGEQSRTHRDLDLIVDRAHEQTTVEALSRLGYRVWHRSAPSPGTWYPASAGGGDGPDEVVAMRDSALRAVEVHFVQLADMELTATSGSIAGRRVRCLSLASQQRLYDHYRARTGRPHPNAALLPRAQDGPPG